MSYNSLMRYARLLKYGSIHTKIDAKTGLNAIVAINNLKLGPAIGGCRLIAYPTFEAALEDGLRLGHMMSYKSAINHLKHGGAKAVLIKPSVIKNREAYFEAFGEFLNDLGGRYITAVDSGTTSNDMDIIARRTKFVTCTSTSDSSGDPSPLTALGVCRAIEAAAKFKLNKDTLDGVHVAIQGAGHVGYQLAKQVIALGARVTITDIDFRLLERCMDELRVEVCPVDAIYDIAADVFAPCALGAILNRDTIERLRVKIVAGSANNQLAHEHYGWLLHERDILYAPDYLINAGGLIHVAVIYDHDDANKALQQIKNIYHTVFDIFKMAKEKNIPTNMIANQIARERLYGETPRS